MTDLLKSLTEAMQSSDDVWRDPRFDCIQWQPTVGPGAMELMIDICRDGTEVSQALAKNKYNDFDVMLSIYNRSLQVWAEYRIAKLEAALRWIDDEALNLNAAEECARDALEEAK